jgi:hypothetical protein
MFAQKKVTLPPGQHKIVILDEADRYPMIISHLVDGQTLYYCFFYLIQVL